MIKRDEHGIICQHDPDVPDYLDGGDSAAREGIMALCGSKDDAGLLPEFYDLNAGLVRHPFQEQWDDSAKTSRDQLVMWAAGCSINHLATALAAQRRYQWFINKDVLLPDVRGHLRRCAGLPPTLLQQVWLGLSILWQSHKPEEEELNQLLCMCIVAGPGTLKLFVKMLPNWKHNLEQYWNGWRDQSEIGAALMMKVNEVVNG